jgi:hypothetical protein
MTPAERAGALTVDHPDVRGTMRFADWLAASSESA